MTEPKPPYNVEESSAEVRRDFDRFLGGLAPKPPGPSKRCDLFDPKTCPWCDHYPECAANEPSEPNGESAVSAP